MTTKKQLQANRNNAKLSTGPRTKQGKQICSQNALKHGLRSKHPVIPGEDPIEYQHKLDQLRADINPMNALEDDLVEQIADTSWRLKRLSRIEAAYERYRIERAAGMSHNAGKDEEQILGNAFSFEPLNRLARYEAQLSRRYHRVMQELRELRNTYEQTSFRKRPRPERDREEQQWRERHTQSPPDKIQPQPAATTAASTQSRNPEPVEQTDSPATNVDSTPSGSLAALKPHQIKQLIEQELSSITPEPGQLGPQEVQK